MFNQITTKEWDKVSYQTLGLNQEHAKKFQKFLEEKQLAHALDFGLEGITTCAHVVKHPAQNYWGGRFLVFRKSNVYASLHTKTGNPFYGQR